MREVVEVVAELQFHAPAGQGWVTIGELTEELDRDRSSISRRVSRAINLGYLADDARGGRGKRKKLVIADSMPEDAGVLPDPVVLG